MKLIPIAGYEGIVSIREDGAVRLHDRLTPKGQLRKAKWVTPHLNRKGGYLFVKLTNQEGVRKNHYIHKLVADAFLPNPRCYKTVNHIDCDKSNNHYSNLEHLSHYDNCKHAKDNGLLNPTTVSVRSKFLLNNL